MNLSCLLARKCFEQSSSSTKEVGWGVLSHMFKGMCEGVCFCAVAPCSLLVFTIMTFQQKRERQSLILHPFVHSQPGAELRGHMEGCCA